MDGTYDQALPTDRDWVRFLTGDRGPSPRFVLGDEELDALVADSPNKYLAAARAGEVILAQGRDVVSKVVDGLSLTWSNSPDGVYRTHLKRLREEGAGLTVARPRMFRVL